jgi:hypothetical protein
MGRLAYATPAALGRALLHKVPGPRCGLNNTMCHLALSRPGIGARARDLGRRLLRGDAVLVNALHGVEGIFCEARQPHLFDTQVGHKLRISFCHNLMCIPSQTIPTSEACHQPWRSTARESLMRS